MIYETDIIAALTKRIKQFFLCKVENQDIKNCLSSRPCFFIRSIQTVDAQSASNYELNSFSFEIIYFASENNKGYLELLQTKRKLKAVLNKQLKITKNWTTTTTTASSTSTTTDTTSYTQTSYVEIDSLTSNINEDDYVLNAVLETKIEQSIDYSDLGIDLDSENTTDDADFNREILEDFDAEINTDDGDIDNFTDE